MLRWHSGGFLIVLTNLLCSKFNGKRQEEEMGKVFGCAVSRWGEGKCSLRSKRKMSEIFVSYRRAHHIMKAEFKPSPIQ